MNTPLVDGNTKLIASVGHPIAQVLTPASFSGLFRLKFLTAAAARGCPITPGARMTEHQLMAMAGLIGLPTVISARPGWRSSVCPEGLSDE